MGGATGDKDYDDLVNDINRLELKQKERERLPPPPSSSAWTFKKGSIDPGHLVQPDRLRQPSYDYAEIARRSCQTLAPSDKLGKRPQLIVLDLNNTLLARKKATTAAARNAVMRPFLSSFLEYLCGTEEIEGKIQRRFNVMV